MVEGDKQACDWLPPAPAVRKCLFTSLSTVAFSVVMFSCCFDSLLQPQCALHIHIVLSHWYYYISSVLSSDSAIGIIVAQGNELYDSSLNELTKGQVEAVIKTEVIIFLHS